MTLFLLRQISLLVALLALVGCASAPKQVRTQDQAAGAPANVIGQAETGSLVQLPAGNSLGQGSVFVDRTYYSASGKQCKRIRSSDGVLLTRVACKSRNGAWQFARDLSTNSSSAIVPLPVGAVTGSPEMSYVTQQPLVPRAESPLLVNRDGTVSPLTPPAGFEASLNVGETITETEMQANQIPISSMSFIERELRRGETLWTFAQRTTGDPLNWKLIAELNGIADINSLAPGTVLRIPAELVGSGG